MVSPAFLLMTLAAGASPDSNCATKAMAAPAVLAVDGTSLAYVRCGQGAPTIVFEGGFGGNLQNWERIFPLVGSFAPVFAYSRPGFRGSDQAWSADSDGVRTSEEAAKLLHVALRKAGVRPPYLLVGHSLGGLYIQKFAQLYPRETAGLVLMDNRPATLMRRCAGHGVPECDGNIVSPDWSPVLKSTYLGIKLSEAVAPKASQLGAIPVLVITAGAPEEGIGRPFFDLFRNAQTEFSRQLRKGRQVVIADATHSSLSRQHAEQTVAAIRIFWSQLARRPHRESAR